jgi:hypothetical protein
MPPAYVKPYVKRGKSDAADAVVNVRYLEWPPSPRTPDLGRTLPFNTYSLIDLGAIAREQTDRFRPTPDHMHEWRSCSGNGQWVRLLLREELPFAGRGVSSHFDPEEPSEARYRTSAKGMLSRRSQ